MLLMSVVRWMGWIQKSDDNCSREDALVVVAMREDKDADNE